MKTYTAISIGPIIDTLSQVRKPRHLWSASYIFSHLMKIIIEQGIDLGGTLISPAKDVGETSGIGLYPDRAFFKSENVIDIVALTNKVFEQLHDDIGISVDSLNKYFNLMGTSTTLIENSESKTIGELNKKLDVLELSNRCEDRQARDEILKLILTTQKSPLFKLGFKKGKFKIKDLSVIATRELECKEETKVEWKKIKSKLEEGNKKQKKEDEESQIYLKNEFISDEDYSDYLDSVEDDDFYKALAKNSVIKPHLKSYHKYFCVVQADGDSIGKVIANLDEGKLNELSNSLITFGKAATKQIEEFGGLPIYAGGDDLLFIAPVVSGEGSIFKLIDDIDKLYKEKVKYETNMSYGISISYYKYPLYEVLADARELLFTDAKTDRNTIACRLRKHSGSSFKITLNKADDSVKKQFEALMKIDVKENVVSAVAHKLRDTSVLWLSTHGDEKRLEAFFKKFMGLTEKELKEEKEEKKGKELKKEKSYLIVVKNTLKALIEKHESSIEARIAKELEKEIEELELKKKKARKKIEDELNQNIYAMLRTAKFIKGEELKDE